MSLNTVLSWAFAVVLKSAMQQRSAQRNPNGILEFISPNPPCR
jgi:hypothetical protein